ncbi:hypothetical protein GQ600_8930 [Phytophthora cactorum]|nr:hypothetical protein GQ600_8930 [Phytophthora cactorum]
MGKKSRRQRLNAGKPPPTKATDASASHAVDTQHLKLDPRGDGMYSGTFRWLESKVFPQLPPFPSHSVDLSAGWKEFLASRSSHSDHVDLVATATYDPSMLDALSFPVTLLHVTQLLHFAQARGSKAEQRVWRISNYWNEVAAFYAKPKSLSSSSDQKSTSETRMESRKINPGTSRFVTLEGPDTSVIVGYNTGFGNFVDSHRHELLFSWLPDLHCIAEHERRVCCAVTHRWRQHAAAAKQNPFSAASHFHEEERRDTACRQGTTIQCDCGDVGALQKRLDAELDIHLEDKLGRHFYKGMVLTKDQAARCKALTGKQAPSETPGLHNDAPQSQLETPRFELMPGQRENEIVAVILVPRIKSASEQIAVDLTDSVLTVFVPGKYLLKTKLPFQVDQAAGSLQAVLTPPILRVSFRKK